MEDIENTPGKWNTEAANRELDDAVGTRINSLWGDTNHHDDLIFTQNSVELDGVRKERPQTVGDENWKAVNIEKRFVRKKEKIKAEYIGLKTFFAGVDWTEMKRITNVQEKYDTYEYMQQRNKDICSLLHLFTFTLKSWISN